jgi:IgGFc binding protein
MERHHIKSLLSNNIIVNMSQVFHIISKSIKMKSHVISLFVLAFFSSGISAQDISNEGKDFWVGYGLHQFMEDGQNNSQEMVLYFSAKQNANVRVTVKGQSATLILNYFVAANSVVASAFMPKINGHPNDCRLYDANPSFGGFGGEKIFDRNIHIESDAPIVAYAHIFGSVSSGATMLLPTPSWGHKYYTINSEQINAAGPGFNWFYIIASENNTVVRITPSAISRLGKPPGVPFDVTLQKGQIYQLVGQADGGGNGVQLTGSHVESIANPSGQCFPIAVFAGSSRTRGESVPCGSGSGRDNDMQQCFPTHAWGKQYLTAPFSTSTGPSANTNINANVFMTSVYKVVVKDPATVVKRNGVTLTGLINGRYYIYSSNTADYLEADKPIMVGQFMSGSSICNPGTWGDPEMVFLSPIAQAINKVAFYRNTREAIYTNYVTLIIPTAGVPSLRIDNSSVFNHTYPHPNKPGYTVVVKGWQAAQTQTNIVSDSSFTAITYGLGSAESYASTL